MLNWFFKNKLLFDTEPVYLWETDLFEIELCFRTLNFE